MIEPRPNANPEEYNTYPRGVTPADLTKLFEQIQKEAKERNEIVQRVNEKAKKEGRYLDKESEPSQGSILDIPESEERIIALKKMINDDNF